MEIHAPEGPIHSVRHFLIHLLTITIGILIALSLEGLNEWRHHRNLVHEAQSNLANELHDNKRALEGKLKGNAERAKDLKRALQLVTDVLTRGKSDIESYQIGYNPAQLSATSWNTAGAMGALGHMKYAAVKKYSAVYDLQQQFNLEQQRAIANVLAAIASTQGQNPEKSPRADIERSKQQIQTALVDIIAEEQLGNALLRTYDEALSEKASH
jgi:hypothetical protein